MEVQENTVSFILCTLGGAVVHSYGRLILNETVITDRHQLQPPNNDNGDGRIECAVSSGEAKFDYTRDGLSSITSNEVHERKSGSEATFEIEPPALKHFRNLEGDCGSIYHYLYLSNGEMHLCSTHVRGEMRLRM